MNGNNKNDTHRYHHRYTMHTSRTLSHTSFPVKRISCLVIWRMRTTTKQQESSTDIRWGNQVLTIYLTFLFEDVCSFYQFGYCFSSQIMIILRIISSWKHSSVGSIITFFYHIFTLPLDQQISTSRTDSCSCLSS
jgi:hypothetical protein